MTMRTDSEPRTNSQALVSDEEVKALILSARPYLQKPIASWRFSGFWAFWELGEGIGSFSTTLAECQASSHASIHPSALRGRARMRQADQGCAPRPRRGLQAIAAWC